MHNLKPKTKYRAVQVTIMFLADSVDAINEIDEMLRSHIKNNAMHGEECPIGDWKFKRLDDLFMTGPSPTKGELFIDVQRAFKLVLKYDGKESSLETSRNFNALFNKAISETEPNSHADREHPLICAEIWRNGGNSGGKRGSINWEHLITLKPQKPPDHA